MELSRSTPASRQATSCPCLPTCRRIVKALVLSGFLAVEKRQDLLALAGLLATGQVTPVIDRTYPLDDAADALHYVGAGHTRGRSSPSDDRADENDLTRAKPRPDLPPLRRTDRSPRKWNLLDNPPSD